MESQTGMGEMETATFDKNKPRYFLTNKIEKIYIYNLSAVGQLLPLLVMPYTLKEYVYSLCISSEERGSQLSVAPFRPFNLFHRDVDARNMTGVGKMVIGFRTNRDTCCLTSVVLWKSVLKTCLTYLL